MNVFFIFNYIGRPQHKGPKESSSFIAKELNLNEAQIQQFKKLEEEHHNTMRTIGDGIKKDKDVLFEKITAPQVNEATIDSLITSITNKEQLVEKEMFKRLRGIYKLCNDQQKNSFTEIMKKARRPDDKGPKEPRRRE